MKDSAKIRITMLGSELNKNKRAETYIRQIYADLMKIIFVARISIVTFRAFFNTFC